MFSVQVMSKIQVSEKIKRKIMLQIVFSVYFVAGIEVNLSS